MSISALRVFCRVVERRLRTGENLEDILAGYPNLTEEDKAQIRDAVKED